MKLLPIEISSSRLDISFSVPLKTEMILTKALWTILIVVLIVILVIVILVVAVVVSVGKGFQASREIGNACTSNVDCTSPLVCTNGRCSVNQSCTRNSDCPNHQFCNSFGQCVAQ